MKMTSTVRNILFVLLASLMMSACGVQAVQPALALEPTDTPFVAPTDAPAEPDEPVASPTSTLVPATPTASRIEFSVSNAAFEVKVINMEKPSRVYPGGDTEFLPGEGNLFIGLGLKVTNFTGTDIPLRWSDIYLMNKYEDKWYPVWGAYGKTNTVIDPLTVQVLEFEVSPDFDPDALLYFADNGYLRAIFRVPKDNLHYYFRFSDLPLVEIDYRYH